MFLRGASFARTQSGETAYIPRWRELKINSIKIAVNTQLLRHFGSSTFAQTRAYTEPSVFQPVLKLLAQSKRGPLITTGNCHYNLSIQSCPIPSTILAHGLQWAKQCGIENCTLFIVTITSRVQSRTSQLS